MYSQTPGDTSLNFTAKAVSFYIDPGTYGTKRESMPRSYVMPVSSWLDAGLDYRMRSEYRKFDIRRPDPNSTDYPILLRARAYLGVQVPKTPLSMVAELEDANRVNSQFAIDNRDVNRGALIQGYASLKFPRLLGTDTRNNARPVMVQAGRMTFEMLDRRLIALNAWRNTTNNFDGFYGSLGKEANDWQLELLALRPVIRRETAADQTDKDRVFVGAIGHWRRWSKLITLEPYYLALHQRPTAANSQRERHIHGLGLRAYGWVAKSGFNFDLTGMYQTGTEGALDHRAGSFTAEVGHQWKTHKIKPRMSVFYGYASGDQDASDQVSNRFERYFGFARPWSADDYIVMENISTTKLRAECEPFRGVRADMGYGYYWLASATDRMNNLLAGSAFNRDATGQSGRFLGHGWDGRIRTKAFSFTDITVGRSHFFTGDFIRNRQKSAVGHSAANSAFAYLEVSIDAARLFDTLKK